MTIFTKAANALGRAYKAATSILFSRSASGGGWWPSSWQGGTRYDYAATVQPTNNGIVIACLEVFASAFSGAPLRIQRVNGSKLEPVPDHPMLQLLNRPNPYYSGVLMWKAMIWDWLLGNAYLLKERSAAGRVVGYFWIPQAMMAPRWDPDGGGFVDWYDYTVDGRKYRYAVEDVFHVRNGFDPKNIRVGLSRLAALFREIATDDEAANFSASLLRNTAVPSVVIAPEGDSEIVAPEEIKASFMQKFSGDKRGEPLVMSGPTKVSVLSFSPEQMNLEKLRRIPEERISAAIGVPAIVAGLGAGLAHSTYANVASAREMLHEVSVIPAYMLFAAEIAAQLLPDFDDPAKFVVDFDLSKVRVLAEDQDKLHQRARENLKAGGITVNEFRQVVGLEPLVDGDVLLIPTNLAPTPPDELLSAPEPMPAPAPLVVPAALPPAPDDPLAVDDDDAKGRTNGHADKALMGVVG